MEVLIQENDIIIVKALNDVQSGHKVFLTYGFREQITSARDICPEAPPLEKDIYLISIGNKAQTLKLLNEGKVKVYGDREELTKILLEND